MSLVKDAVGSYAHPADPGEPIYNQPRVSITDEEGVILAGLVRGCRVLEIGTGLGVSTRYLASTASLVVSYDIDPWVRETVWPTLAGIKNLTLLSDVPTSQHGRFDVVFIDGNHEAESVERDVDIAIGLVVSPGRLIFHDAKANPTYEACEFKGLAPMRVIPTTYDIGVVDV